MTKAVCFNCGKFKFGAFKTCGSCKRAPETDDQLAMSSTLTDHYFDLPTLKAMGKDIKNGKSLRLDPQTKENQLSGLGALKETTGIQFNQSIKRESTLSKKPHEKPVGRNMATILFAMMLLMIIFLAAYLMA